MDLLNAIDMARVYRDGAAFMDDETELERALAEMTKAARSIRPDFNPSDPRTKRKIPMEILGAITELDRRLRGFRAAREQRADLDAMTGRGR